MKRCSSIDNAGRSSRIRSVGGGMAEYLLIIFLVGFAALGAVRHFGKVARAQTGNMAKELANENADLGGGSGSTGPGAPSNGGNPGDQGGGAGGGEGNTGPGGGHDPSGGGNGGGADGGGTNPPDDGGGGSGGGGDDGPPLTCPGGA